MSRGLHVPLDVDYYDDEKIIEAGERAELLFVRALCLMKKRKSDGRIADAQLGRFGLSAVKARADALVKVGLWERVPGGYFCPSWLKHNKSKDEIEERQERQRVAALKANHDRWHSDEPRVACPFCDPISDRSSERTETETETETETSDGTAPAHLCPDPFVIDDDLRKWGVEKASLVDLPALAQEMVFWSRANGKRRSSWRRTLQSWATRRQKELAEKQPRGGDLAW